MATTKVERVNLSLTREERSTLERIAKDEDRSMTWIAAFFVRFGMSVYCDLDSSVKNMRNLDLEQLLHVSQAQERRKSREHADQKLREETVNVPDNNHETRKRA